MVLQKTSEIEKKMEGLLNEIASIKNEMWQFKNDF